MKQYFSFQWHITDECDQRCRHCYIFSEDNGKKPNAMTWEQMQDVVDNCCDMCEMYDRLPYFYLTGGDPILHPDFWRLLGLLRERDIPFTIMGNPFHLNDEICKRLKSYGCQKYQLSLDGMRETHDWFRKPGSFDCTLEKIACIKNAGIRSVIMTTVSGANIKEVPKIIDIVVQYEADVYAFARYCPTSEEKDTGMTPQEYRALLASCYRSCLELAERYNVKSVAFCCISTGEFHFPNDRAAEIAVRTVKEYRAYWSRYITVNRYMDPPRPVYQNLLELVKDKDYFVLTTNVDHCFQKAGFDKKRLSCSWSWGWGTIRWPAVGQTGGWV